jgi:Cft2 family RNA processing exonuclease
MSFNKFYLIDEHEYARLTRPLAIKNELSWKRPIDVRAKNEDSRSMKNILADESMSDDLKSKTYNQSLSRFINTKTSIPQQQKQELDSIKEKTPDEKKKKKKTKKQVIVRRSPIRLRPMTKRRKFDETIWSEY